MSKQLAIPAVLGFMLILALLLLWNLMAKRQQEESQSSSPQTENTESDSSAEGGEAGSERPQDKQDAGSDAPDGETGGLGQTIMESIRAGLGQKEAFSDTEEAAPATPGAAASHAEAQVAAAQTATAAGREAEALEQLMGAWTSVNQFAHEDQACADLQRRCEAEMKPLVESLNEKHERDILNDKALFID